ncbi:MAG: alpha/beta fold hydrolase [Proteobacteria bacterium]|nr:alpha/beta fold hydrolase [Pseudomonadota bacterium]
MTSTLELVTNGPHGARCSLVMAHGAGQGMHSDFMTCMAEGVAAAGIRVVRFEFPYMRKGRQDGRRRAPDRMPVLKACWLEALAALARQPEHHVFIGGKSMGGRVASLIADEVQAAGLICLGFPFHAPGRSAKGRIEHLYTLKTRALIVQGTRDAFGTPSQVRGYELPAAIKLAWIEDGDHSLKTRARSGRTRAQALQEAVEALVAFIRGP